MISQKETNIGIEKYEKPSSKLQTERRKDDMTANHSWHVKAMCPLRIESVEDDLIRLDRSIKTLIDTK